MIQTILEYPLLPLGTLTIAAAFFLLNRGLRKAEDSDNETLDVLVEDMEALQARVQTLEQKQTDHGNKLSNLALRGVK